ncbi:DUF4003 domain-containing protein [Pueribacillus theae]|uniref:DUF4003 domain-containing protein n=1 Tax=Pueribacillus theae TaxID=2171751 RepID=A0A2U1JJ31_9BACI|nr:DUF4003 family protein [Pueribacillus theae]PWA05141.1 DUF4003 domain-containing protein [Pueribacillus theae]
MNIEQHVSNYINIYDQLQEKLKWNVTDKRILMTIASLYVMKSKAFHHERFIHISDELKKQSSVFSSMRSYLRYTTAATLDVHFENAVELIPTFFSLYEGFIQAKFQRGNFTYISASVLLTKQSNPSHSKEIISKVKAIYNGMRREHFLLTSASDYPLATLLALENRDGIIQYTENFYRELNNNGFRKGNDLQFLSHILSLNKDESVETLVNRTTRIYDAFKESGLKQKTAYYPLMGMLALLPCEEVNMNIIIQIYEQLNNAKSFKWQKDMNVMLAVCFYVSEKLAHESLIETSIYTTIETILQAQQAVMIATIAAATAASTSNSNS